MGSARSLVLVPGACLGGWAWATVAAELRAGGHDVYTVTLTGLGERKHLARRDVDLATHVDDVVNLLDFEQLEDAVLVGHSYAGAVITAVADRRSQRLDTVVYLDCGPLPDGVAIAEVQTPAQREQQAQAVDERGDGWLWPVPDRETLTTGTYGSAAGLEEEHLQRIERWATPQPYATMTSAVRLENHAPPGVKRAAIFCTAGGVDAARVRTLIAAGDPRAGAFDAGWDLYDLPTGHWPMFSLPVPLAELLHRIGSR